MKHYTQHKLTDPMLRRLSQIVHERSEHGHGNALTALERRGLVERIPNAPFPRTHQATAAGIRALKDARALGW